MPSAATGGRAYPGRGRFLGLLLFACLAGGCATTGGVRGKLLTPPARTGVDAESRPAADKTDPITEAVIYAQADRAEHHSGADLKPQHGPRQQVLLGATGFEPRVVPLTVGGTVEFRNKSRVYHKLFSVSPACPFSLAPCAPGQARTVDFTSPGVINVYCELHPAGGGYVVVLPDGRFTRPRADGSFSLSGLTPGPYTVKAWHPILGEATGHVVVASGRQAEIRLIF